MGRELNTGSSAGAADGSSRSNARAAALANWQLPALLGGPSDEFVLAVLGACTMC